MAETPSSMLPLGTSAPDFSLLDTLTQQNKSLNELKSANGTVIMFICNHCPYVKHILSTLVKVSKSYQEKGISFIAINSNDVEKYPADSPENMHHLAQDKQFGFPYLFDDTQAIAKAYHAACTPDFYLFDGNLKCVYRGRFDAATPGNQHPVTGEDLTRAIDALLKNEPISSTQQPSLGCNIKWKK